MKFMRMWLYLPKNSIISLYYFFVKIKQKGWKGYKTIYMGPALKLNILIFVFQCKNAFRIYSTLVRIGKATQNLTWGASGKSEAEIFMK